MDDDDAMAMGGQRHTERSGAPRHPSEATINLCRQFGVGGPPQEFPPVFFFSKKSDGKALSQNLKNLGGDMARPRNKNLASPISDFPPPSTPIRFTAKIVATMGGYSTPRAMDRRIIAMLEHHKYPG